MAKKGNKFKKYSHFFMAKKGSKFKKYSPEFKISCIIDMRSNHLSYVETVRKYWGVLLESIGMFLLLLILTTIALN